MAPSEMKSRAKENTTMEEEESTEKVVRDIAETCGCEIEI